MPRYQYAFTAIAIATFAVAPAAKTQAPVARPDSSGYVAANGIDYWFEIRGKGEPLLLLHGGLMSSEMFGPVLTKLAESRRVISVDLHPALVRRLVIVQLLHAMGEYMRQPYDWSATVKQLTMPVMLVYGDSDLIRPEHIVSFYHLLGGGLKDAGWMRENMSKNRLAILPDLTHYEIGASPALATTVLPFLNK